MEPLFSLSSKLLNARVTPRLQSSLPTEKLEDLLQRSVHGLGEPQWFQEWAVIEQAAQPFDKDKAVLFSKVGLTYDEHTDSDTEIPQLAYIKSYPRVYPSDANLRKELTPLLILHYLVEAAWRVNFSDEWGHRDDQPTYPVLNVKTAYQLAKDPTSTFVFTDPESKEVLVDPHNHVLLPKRLIALLMDSKLYWGTVRHVDTGVHHSIHPLLSLDPLSLWKVLKSQTSLLSFVKSFIQSALDNINSEHPQWYPVHELYGSCLDMTYDQMPGLPAPNRTLTNEMMILRYGHDKELNCTCCGMQLNVERVRLQANNQLEVIVATSTYALRRQQPELPICTGNDWAAVLTTNVSFPTGSILFADWVRHPSFTEKLKFKDRYDTSRRHSLNYPMGRIQQGRDIAEHNIVFGSVGNEAVHVYCFEGGIVLAGYPKFEYEEDEEDETDEIVEEDLEDEDPDEDLEDEDENVPYNDEFPPSVKAQGLTFAGSVCTDLWGYTMVDQETLEAIIKEPTTQSLTVTKHKRYAGDTSLGLLSVEPGQYSHYYTHMLDVEQALDLLPEHVKQRLAPCKFRIIHGVLLKKTS